MKILITNDDGFYADGIRALKAALEQDNDVYVVAPDREKSAASHSLTLDFPLRINRKGEKDHYPVYLLYNQLIKNYENTNRHHEAGDFFAGKMDMRRRGNLDRKFFPWIMLLKRLCDDRPRGCGPSSTAADLAEPVSCCLASLYPHLAGPGHDL